MIVTDAVTLLQNLPNDPQAELHVVSVFPFSARYKTSVDTAPAARIMYVSTYQRKLDKFSVYASINIHKCNIKCQHTGQWNDQSMLKL